MHRLKDRYLASKVRGGRKAEAADQARGEVAEDIAVHVGGDDDLEHLRATHQLMRAVIDDQVLSFDIGIFLSNFLEGALQETFGQLHNIRFGDAMHGLTSISACNLEGQASNLLAAFARNQF